MSNTKYIVGSFGDPDELMDGIDKLQENKISIYDVYTPMPIHGIEAKLGVPPSRLPIVAFIFGCIGLTLGFSLLYYTMVYDWPMNIGGKPAFSAPAFVPVTFEVTILLTALGMVATFSTEIISSLVELHGLWTFVQLTIDLSLQLMQKRIRITIK